MEFSFFFRKRNSKKSLMGSGTKFLTAPLIILLFLTLTFHQTYAEETKYRAIVRLADGTEIKGVLLNLTMQFIQIDPDGPVSFLSIASEKIEFIKIDELNIILSYPLKESDIPSELLRLSKTSTYPIDQSKKKALDGYRSFALIATYGLASTGPKKDRGYYEGFSSGGSFQCGARYHFHEDNRYKGRFFLGLSYQRSLINVDMEPILIGLDEEFNQLYILFEPLTVQNILIEFGGATSIIGKNSYLFFLMGLGYSHNSGTTYGELRTEFDELIAQTEKEEYSDGQFPIRFKIGAVIGISSRIGLEIDLLADILYAGTTQDYTWGQSRPTAKGSLLGVYLGLNIEL